MNIFTKYIKQEKLINSLLEFITPYIKNDDAIDLDIKKYCALLQNFKKDNPEYLQGSISIIINDAEFITDAKKIAKKYWEDTNKKLHLYDNLWFLAPLALLNIKKKLARPNDLDGEFYKTVKNICICTNYDIESILFLFAFLTILQEIICYQFYRKSLVNIKKKIFNICKCFRPMLAEHGDADWQKLLEHDIFWLADLIGMFTMRKEGELDREKILTRVNHDIFCEIILNFWQTDFTQHLNQLMQSPLES